ncbi:MAG TPA: hypothetical protein ENN42_07280 [Thioalkalivibrio sp.]|nr:hypothetical protein [Thioalkalivibrio sp.]
MNDTLVNIVAWAGIAAFVLGLLMIASSAYRRGLVWGVIGLVPVVNFYYVATAWAENKARNGFLLLVAGALAVAVAFYGGADEAVSQTAKRVGGEVGVEVPDIKMPVKATRDVEVPNQAEVEAAGIDTSESVLDRSDYVEGFAVQPLPPEGAQSRPAEVVTRLWYPVCPQDLPGREGRPLRLSLKEGRVLEGKLTQAGDISLRLEQYVQGGVVNYEYRYTAIDRIEVYERERGPVPVSLNCTPPPPAPSEAADDSGSTAVVLPPPAPADE